MTKRSRRDRGRRSGQYPLGTIATYGPDNTRATKLVAAVVDRPDRDPSAMRQWTVDEGDVRRDPAVAAEVAAFLRERHVAHTATADRVMGCPHEEGIDYPMGRSCPRCPFWAGRDRLTHELITVPPPSLSVAEVLRALATDSDETRSAALASADAHRDALVEPLLAAVDRALANPIDASDEDADLFSYALYLFAKWREPRAYRAVVRWLSLPDEQPFDIGGDIVTQDGARILAAVCDGDLGPIKALILDRAANEYGRGAGLSAMALLAAWAELPREPIGEHFRWLAREGLERDASQAWDSLVLACIEVEAIEVFPDLRRAYDEGLADPRFITPGELDDVEAEARGGRLEATRERYAPITDVAEATRWWNRRRAGPEDEAANRDGPSDEDDLDEVPEPYVAPPKIGRNEPCPCGSGKKYKKCHGQ